MFMFCSVSGWRPLNYLVLWCCWFVLWNLVQLKVSVTCTTFQPDTFKLIINHWIFLLLLLNTLSLKQWKMFFPLTDVYSLNMKSDELLPEVSPSTSLKSDLRNSVSEPLSFFFFFFIKPPTASCKGRCGAEYYRGYMCQCDYGCLLYEECCTDYESQCTTRKAFSALTAFCMIVLNFIFIHLNLF